MAFIEYGKANNFLDKDKLEFTGNADIVPELERAEDLIKSALEGSFSAEIDTWLTPATTPKIIQDICGALCAAWRYAAKYSEESSMPNPFAARLEKRAMEILQNLASGVFTIPEVTGAGPTITSDDFYPNDDADEDDPRAFSMTQEF